MQGTTMDKRTKSTTLFGLCHSAEVPQGLRYSSKQFVLGLLGKMKPSMTNQDHHR